MPAKPHSIFVRRILHCIGTCSGEGVRAVTSDRGQSGRRLTSDASVCRLQEQLLLSVIPAYIAAEVKRGIMVKMADVRAADKATKKQFHDLHVQRHNNVR